MQIFTHVNPGKPIPNFPSIIAGLVREEGFTSIYKGLDAAIGRQMVYGTARIGLHRTFSDILVKRDDHVNGVGDISDESVDVVSGVGGGLDSAVGKSNHEATGNDTVGILCFCLLEVGLAVVISDSVLISIRLRGELLGGIWGGGAIGGGAGSESCGEEGRGDDKK